MTGSLSLATFGLCLCFFPSAFSGGQTTTANPADKAPVTAKTIGFPEFALSRLGSPTFHQNGPITSLLCSPDGKLLASTGTDGQIWLWDLAKGNGPKLLFEPSGPVTQVTFSPNGQLLAGLRNQIDPATNAVINEVVIWNTMDGKMTVQKAPELQNDLVLGWKADGITVIAVKAKKLPGVSIPNHVIEPYALAPNGRLLVGIELHDNGKAGPIYLWDLEAKKLQAVACPQTSTPTGLCFSNDGKILFSGYEDGTILAWDAITGKQFKNSDGHTGKVTSVAYSPDSKYLVSASTDKTVRKWEVKTGKLLFTLDAGAEVYSVAYARDGQTFATAGADKLIRIWQASDGKELRQLKGHENAVTDVAFSPDGKHLASRSGDLTVRLWDLASGKEVYVVKNENVDPVLNVPSNVAPGSVPGKNLLFSGDGKYLIVTDYLIENAFVTTVRIRDAANGKELRSFSASGNAKGIALSPDGRTLVIANSTSTAWLYEIATGQVKAKLAGQPSLPSFQTFKQVGFGPQGAFIGGNLNPAFAPAPFGGAFGCFPAGVGLGGGGFGAGFGGFNPNFGGFGVGGGFNLGFGGFNPGFGGWGVGGDGLVGFNAIGGQFSINQGNDLMLQTAHHPGHSGPITALAYAAKGKYLVTGGQDHNVLLWNSLTTRVVLDVGKHQGAVTCAACSPDSSTLATGGADTTVLIWDMTKLTESAKYAESLDRLWNDLGDPQAAPAFKAVQELTDHPDLALALFKQKLKPAKLPSTQIQKWLTDLGSNQFLTREKAAKELEKLVETIEPALQQVMNKPPNLEVHMRLQGILKKLPKDALSVPRLQQMRALEVLERLESSQAVTILQGLAQGAPEAWLTHEAQNVLQRLKE